jgi:hypothetical protein
MRAKTPIPTIAFFTLFPQSSFQSSFEISFGISAFGDSD